MLTLFTLMAAIGKGVLTALFVFGVIIIIGSLNRYEL